jgi:hypothetical protein
VASKNNFVEDFFSIQAFFEKIQFKNSTKEPFFFLPSLFTYMKEVLVYWREK